ncbi:HupE/UreJ family protein [Luteibacter sp. NPDC031894]|uniref:HupE/UreJ family protein n=1 Tax=Luteibacter sp. NPDC031894 TaxID=3390572 RepID=UPI003CFDD0B7
MSKTSHAASLTAAMVWLGYTGAAMAHAGTGLAGGFTAGFAHPFGGWDHLLAMVSVGLWGAFLGDPLVYRLPVVFPGLMVVGAILGMAGVPLPPVEWGIALSVFVLGGCIAAAWRPPMYLAIAIVAVFGLFHGYAHGKELPSAAEPVGYAAGFVLATGSLHVLGIALGMVTRWRQGIWAVRIGGAVIAAAGTWFIAQASGDTVRDRGEWLFPIVVLSVVVAATCVVVAKLTASNQRGRIVAWRVLISWLVAVAALTATLAFLPVTPGYAPDHLE